MQLTIKTDEAVGMEAGYTQFEVIVSNTQYSEKGLLNSLKLTWSPTLRQWSTSGCVKLNKKATEAYLFDRYVSKLTRGA
jgi:hypothetical protein